MCLVDKEVELEIASRELHAACNRCPFAERDRFAIGSAIGEGISADDIFLEQVV